MSLVSQVTALASRIASEFNTVRSEISSLETGNFPTGETFPFSPSTGQTFFETTQKVAYVYSGEFWIPLNAAYVLDGGDVDAEASNSIDGGYSDTETSNLLDGGDA